MNFFALKFDGNFLLDNKENIIEIKIDNNHKLRHFFQKDVIIYFYCPYLNKKIDGMIDIDAYLIFDNIYIKENNNYFFAEVKAIKNNFKYTKDGTIWDYNDTINDLVDGFYNMILSTINHLSVCNIKDYDKKVIFDMPVIFDKLMWNILIPTIDKRSIKLKEIFH